MSRKLDKEYFEWLCHLVEEDLYFNGKTYHALLLHLHNIEFYYTIEMDENRAVDGTDLRYHFKYERGYDSQLDILGDKECSVLEMMIALAVRCERQIAYDPDYGDRTALWFWSMIQNLGLEEMDDNHFDVDYVDSVIFRFLNREYEANGKGGLFTVDRRGRDLRDVEIWYQMNWYLNEIL